MQQTANPLVSVVIPAFNAAATLRGTLQSALAQTYAPLEIVVVDDGSTDATPEIIAEFAARHPHIRPLRIANSGVAAARNAGIAASRGEFVAPLDADDLWHPERVAEHVRALRAAGERAAVAYSPFLIIDAEDRITGASPVHTDSGRIFARHLRQNLVGNGSSMTMRRAAAIAAGGYPEELRREGVQGCEDLSLQLRLAYAHDFVSVPRALIGYRKVAGNMSADEARMLRSRIRVIRSMAALPGVAGSIAFNRALYDTCGLLVTWLFFDRGAGEALAELRRQVRRPLDVVGVPLFAAGHLLVRSLRRLAKRFLGPARRPGPAGQRFSEWIGS